MNLPKDDAAVRKLFPKSGEQMLQSFRPPPPKGVDPANPAYSEYLKHAKAVGVDDTKARKLLDFFLREEPPAGGR